MDAWGLVVHHLADEYRINKGTRLIDGTQDGRNR